MVFSSRIFSSDWRFEFRGFYRLAVTWSFKNDKEAKRRVRNISIAWYNRYTWYITVTLDTNRYKTVIITVMRNISSLKLSYFRPSFVHDYFIMPFLTTNKPFFTTWWMQNAKRNTYRYIIHHPSIQSVHTSSGSSQQSNIIIYIQSSCQTI